MIRLKTFDWTLAIVLLVFAVISIATIYTITYISVGNKLVISQSIFMLIGFILFAIFSIVDYRQLRSYAWILFGTGIVLLLPLLPMWSHKLPFVICEFNACRWLDLILFRFQTSETLKLIIVIIFATILSDRVGKLSFGHGLLLLGLLAIPTGLIIEQPDLGTAMVVVFCGFIMLIMARLPIWFWAVLFGLVIVLSPIGWRSLKPYQKTRIEIFLHPEKDPNKTGYNVRQSEIAVGSGGVFGRGFGQGSQSQLNFLPVAHTDFIFAGYAEATGFAGAALLVGLFVFTIWRAIRIAEIARDNFGRLLSIGIAAMIAIQVFINIGMNIRIMPVTGVPLPLISYGGTSLFVTMISMGILQSIAIRHKKMSFG